MAVAAQLATEARGATAESLFGPARCGQGPTASPRMGVSRRAWAPQKGCSRARCTWLPGGQQSTAGLRGLVRTPCPACPGSTRSGGGGGGCPAWETQQHRRALFTTDALSPGPGGARLHMLMHRPLRRGKQPQRVLPNSRSIFWLQSLMLRGQVLPLSLLCGVTAPACVVCRLASRLAPNAAWIQGPGESRSPTTGSGTRWLPEAPPSPH